MWPVADKAVCVYLAGDVRFMTVKASRAYTMFVCMTTCAANFRVMLGGIGFEFLSFRIVMADLAGNDIFTCLILDLLAHP